LEALKNGLRLRPEIAAAFLKELSGARGAAQHFAVDLWFCFCMHSSPGHREKVEKLLKRKAESGCLDAPHLVDALKVV
jgi:hypothetical protein